MSAFRSLDLFKKVNQDIDTSSTTGGIYSILALISGFILFWNEFSDFRTDELAYQMRIKQQSSEIIKAEVDILVTGSPCHLLSLDIADEVGNHTLDFMDTLTKTRILQDGTPLEIPLGEGINMYRGSQQEFEETAQSILNKEGCRLQGHLPLKAVPGNFHISYHAKLDLLQKLSIHKPQEFQLLNLNHKINHIGFGEQQEVIANISKIMGNKFQMENIDSSPIDGRIFERNEKCDFDNYLKVLPAHYESKKSSFQADRFKFAVYSQTIVKHRQETPSIFFRYDISPINVFYKTKSKSSYHFIVQIFAIVGGIFSVIGIMSSLTSGVIGKFRKNT